MNSVKNTVKLRLIDDTIKIQLDNSTTPYMRFVVDKFVWSDVHIIVWSSIQFPLRLFLSNSKCNKKQKQNVLKELSK